MSIYRGIGGTLQVTLKNLVMNGSFENAGWSGGTYDSSIKKYGAYSYKVTGKANLTETCAYTTTDIELNNTHIYYVRVEGYQPTGSPRYVQIYFPVAEPRLAAPPAGTVGSWNLYSAKESRSTFESGSYPLRVDFENAYSTDSIYFDGIMLIDLTASFGSSNEPTKEWCDANIPYFDHSLTINYNGGINREVKKQFRGFQGVNREIKEEYRGVAGVNRKVFTSSTPITLLNLVKDSNFLNDRQYYDYDNCAYGSDPLYSYFELRAYGSDSRFNYANVRCDPYSNKFQVYSNNKYYVREKIKINSIVNLGFIDVKTGLTTEQNINKDNVSNFPSDWFDLSGVETYPGANNEGYIFYFINGGSGTRAVAVDSSVCASVGKILVLDLTIHFGVGKEPTKEWCDVNIPYFDGTYILNI